MGHHMFPLMLAWAAMSTWQLVHCSSDTKNVTSPDASLNPAWVLESCQYGDMPGTWAVPPLPPDSINHRWDQFHRGHATYPYVNSSLDFGARWQTLEGVMTETCRLRNLIQPFITQSESWVPKPPSASIKIMAISDSTDSNFLNYFVDTLARRAGGNTTEVYKCVFEGSRIVLHDRGPIPILNHVVTGVGLTLFQMYIMGIDQRRPDYNLRVSAARKQFDELMPSSADSGGRPQQPDIVVLHANHWTLKMVAEGHVDVGDRNISNLLALPPDYIAGYVQNLTLLARLVRETFPGSLMVYHTSAMVRHNPETGKTHSRQEWINKMHVSQLNAAGRLVAKRLRLPLVDWEMISQGLVPSQHLFDEVHSADWILFEYYNIFLNLLDDFRTREKAAVGTAR